ncbi:MAG: methyltransferase domain-containing protein [Acidimicrobiia bacterium]
MHDSSFAKMSAFVDQYLSDRRDSHLEILDFGSQEIGGQPDSSYRNLFDTPDWVYRGLDMVQGPNVDIVVTDPFSWPSIADDSIDVVVSGQVLEHVDYFWISVFEIGRVLRPGGIATLIAPSAGPEHRFPRDCWRFYTDGFESIAGYLGFDVLDVYTDWGRDTWADSMLVMRKPVWDLESRAEFRRRSAHQRAARPEGEFVAPGPESVPPVASVLAGLVGDRLAPILEAQRAAAGLSPSRRPGSAEPLWSRTKAAVLTLLGPRWSERARALKKSLQRRA